MRHFSIAPSLLSLATVAAAVLWSSIAGAGPTPGDPNAAAIAALKTFELPDKTASIRIPADWRVIGTGVGFVQAAGSNGELAYFGVMIPAKNAPQASLTPGAILQPYGANPTQKFLASVDWVRQHNGQGPVQAQFYSNTPISAPAAFGQCSNITAILAGSMAVESDFCSLPMDSAGNYRNFVKVVGLPARSAAQERSLMEAILSSYRLNMQAIQKASGARPPAQASGGAEVRATTPAVSAPTATAKSMAATVSAQNSLIANQLMLAEAAAIMNNTNHMAASANIGFSNFDHGVLRGETPIYASGAPQPVFWVGN